MRTFWRYDDEMVRETVVHWNDKKALIASSIYYGADLKYIFRQDAKTSGG